MSKNVTLARTNFNLLPDDDDCLQQMVPHPKFPASHGYSFRYNDPVYEVDAESVPLFTCLHIPTSSPDSSCWIDRAPLGVFLADTLKLSISPKDSTTSSQPSLLPQHRRHLRCKANNRLKWERLVTIQVPCALPQVIGS